MKKNPGKKGGGRLPPPSTGEKGKKCPSLPILLRRTAKLKEKE